MDDLLAPIQDALEGQIVCFMEFFRAAIVVVAANLLR